MAANVPETHSRSNVLRAAPAIAAASALDCPVEAVRQFATHNALWDMALYLGVGWLLAATRKRKGTRPCLTGQASHAAR